MKVLLRERKKGTTTRVERRRHKRIGTTFPVKFQIVTEDKAPLSPEIFKGHTKDISEGGMCIETRAIDEAWAQFIAANGCLVKLLITIPFGNRPVEAYGKVAWLKRDDSGKDLLFRFGLAYLEVDPIRLAQIMSYGKTVRFLPKIIAGLLTIVTVFLGATLLSVKAHRSQLEAQLAEVVEMKEELDQELTQALQEREAMAAELSSLFSGGQREVIKLIMVPTEDGEDGGNTSDEHDTQNADSLSTQLERALVEKEELERKLQYTNEEKKLLAQYLAKFRERGGHVPQEPAPQPETPPKQKPEQPPHGVRLKDGSLTEGTVIGTTPEGVIIKVEYGEINMDWDMLSAEEVKKWKR